MLGQLQLAGFENPSPVRNCVDLFDRSETFKTADVCSSVASGTETQQVEGQRFHLPTLEQLLEADQPRMEGAGGSMPHAVVHHAEDISPVNKPWTGQANNWSLDNDTPAAYHQQLGSCCTAATCRTYIENEFCAAPIAVLTAVASAHGEQWLAGPPMMYPLQCQQQQQQRASYSAQGRGVEPAGTVDAVQHAGAHHLPADTHFAGLTAALAASTAISSPQQLGGVHPTRQHLTQLEDADEASKCRSSVLPLADLARAICPFDPPLCVLQPEDAFALNLQKPLMEAAASLGSNSGSAHGDHMLLLDSGFAARQHAQRVGIVDAGAAAMQQGHCHPSTAESTNRMDTAGSLNSSNTCASQPGGGFGSSLSSEIRAAAPAASSGGSRTLCAGCMALEGEADKLADRCASSSKVQPADKSSVQKLLFQAAACPQLCLISNQLPAAGASSKKWWISFAKARQAQQGGQRAEAGTVLGRNFNFNANAPCPVSESGVPHAAGPCVGNTQALYYTINSSDRRAQMTAIAIAKKSQIAADATAQTALLATTVAARQGLPSKGHSVGSSSNNSPLGSMVVLDSMWSMRELVCSKNNKLYKGKIFDLFKYAFFFSNQRPQSVSVTGAKRKAADVS